MRPFLDNSYSKGQTYQQHLNRKPPSKNPGQDVSTPMGTPLFAPATCTVQTKTDQNGALYVEVSYANIIWQIVHLSGFATRGITVLEGSVIGYSGNSGNSTGPHTHFTLYIDGKRVDPMLHFPDLLFPTVPILPIKLTNLEITTRCTLGSAKYNIRKEPTTKSDSLGLLAANSIWVSPEIASGEVKKGNPFWFKYDKGWISGVGVLSYIPIDLASQARVVKLEQDMATIHEKSKP